MPEMTWGRRAEAGSHPTRLAKGARPPAALAARLPAVLAARLPAALAARLPAALAARFPAALAARFPAVLAARLPAALAALAALAARFPVARTRAAPPARISAAAWMATPGAAATAGMEPKLAQPASSALAAPRSASRSTQMALPAHPKPFVRRSNVFKAPTLRRRGIHNDVDASWRARVVSSWLVRRLPL